VPQSPPSLTVRCGGSRVRHRQHDGSYSRYRPPTPSVGVLMAGGPAIFRTVDSLFVSYRGEGRAARAASPTESRIRAATSVRSWSRCRRPCRRPKTGRTIPRRTRGRPRRSCRRASGQPRRVRDSSTVEAAMAADAPACPQDLPPGGCRLRGQRQTPQPASRNQPMGMARSSRPVIVSMPSATIRGRGTVVEVGTSTVPS
jgi:hypothetical protein